MGNLEKRLIALETAHRGLHARHEGLMMVCRSMLPLIKANPSDVRRMSVVSYDALTCHMNTYDFDDEFQQVARAAIDELFHPIIAVLPDNFVG